MPDYGSVDSEALNRAAIRPVKACEEVIYTSSATQGFSAKTFNFGC